MYGRSITYRWQVHHLYVAASLEQVIDLTHSRLQLQASPIQAAAPGPSHHLLAVEVEHIEDLKHQMAPRVGPAVAGGRAWLG